MERGEDYWRVQSARRRDFWKRCLEANVERNAYDSVYAKAFCTVRCGRGAPKELKYYDPDYQFGGKEVSGNQSLQISGPLLMATLKKHNRSRISRYILGDYRACRSIGTRRLLPTSEKS